jgi:hypothetical protein
LNNIEGLTMALGLGSGLAGILTILGVGLSLAGPKIKEFIESFVGGPEKAQGFIDKVKDLEGTVKTLLEKQGVSIIDLANLDNARAKLDVLKKDQASFNALAGAQTNLQGKVAKGVKDVVVEEAGGTDEESGAENLAKLMEAAQRRQGTFGQIGANTGLNTERDALDKRLKGDKAEFDAGASSPEQAEFLLRRMQADEDRIKTLDAQIRDNARKANDDTIGAAGRGIESARGRIAGLFDANPDIFTTGAGVANPVGAGFRGKLEMASPENIRAGEAFEKASKAQAAITRAQVEQAKKDDDAAKAAAKADGKAMAEDKAQPDMPVKVRMLGQAGAAALGPDKAPKGKIDSDKDRQAAVKARQAAIQARQKEAMARSIFAEAGGRLTPDQARTRRETPRRRCSRWGGSARPRLGGEPGDVRRDEPATRRDAADGDEDRAAGRRLPPARPGIQPGPSPGQPEPALRAQ